MINPMLTVFLPEFATVNFENLSEKNLNWCCKNSQKKSFFTELKIPFSNLVIYQIEMNSENMELDTGYSG